MKTPLVWRVLGLSTHNGFITVLDSRGFPLGTLQGVLERSSLSTGGTSQGGAAGKQGRSGAPVGQQQVRVRGPACPGL